MRGTPVPGPAGRVLNPQEPATLDEKPVRWPTRQCGGSLLKPLPQVLLERRMTREFRPDPVRPDILEAILELARQAPSTFNLQPWRLVVVQDAAVRQHLSPHAGTQAPVLQQAPVVLVALGMKEEWKATLEEVLEAAVHRGAELPEHQEHRRQVALSVLGHEPVEVWVHRQTAVLLTTAMLLAEAYGLDTALLDQVDAAGVRQVLNAPEEAEVVALLALGHGAGPERPYPGRFALARLAYRERFGVPWENGER